MRATQGVSFPRSGHAAIYHIARLYFGDAFIYCDVNNTRFCGCGSVPCINPNRTFAKNHDFGLRKPPSPRKILNLRQFLSLHKFRGVPIIPTEHYFIQYRSPVPAITSNFKVYLKKNPRENHRAGWEKFAFRDVNYWNRFIDKWVLDFPPDANPPLYCTYESLLANPQARVREILTFLSNAPLDDNRVEQIMQQIPIVPRNSISEFDFYDSVFFKELEDIASQRLAKLGLPSFKERIQAPFS